MEYTFSIYYKKCPEGYCPNYPLEEKLDSLANSLGGREVGTGFSFADGCRDVQYVFDNEKNAKDFRDMLNADHGWWITEISEIRAYKWTID